MRRHGVPVSGRRLVRVLVGSVATWLGGGWLAALALTHRARAPFAEPAPEGFETIRLRTSDGLGIGAWWSRDASAPIGLVLAHGNGASRTALTKRAIDLRGMGCDVLSISLRAHGDSDGEWNDLGFSARHDIAAAVRTLRAASPARPVVVLGVSLGSAAALFAAADEASEPIDGMVLVAPYADLRAAVRRRTRRYLPPGIEAVAYATLRFGGRLALPSLDQIRPVEAAARLRPGLPLLVAVGGIRRAGTARRCGGDRPRAPEHHPHGAGGRRARGHERLERERGGAGRAATLLHRADRSLTVHRADRSLRAVRADGLAHG